MARILGIGEVLWDILPDGAQLGGAPANFSVMASRLGDDVALMSRLGMDALGEKTVARLGAFPLERRLIQKDTELPTGQVTVEMNQGQPDYVIHEPAAWDAFELTEEWIAEARRADAVCFGSLAQRHARSRETIMGVVKATRWECLRVFDVNLRPPFYSSEVVSASIALATVLKLNDVEMPKLLALLDLPDPGLTLNAGTGVNPDRLRAGAERILERFEWLQLVAVTCGGEGSLLVTRDEWHRDKGVPITVADTVGAGDAFTAALTHYWLRGAPLETLNRAGNCWGSFVASRKGAMPEITREQVQDMERLIEG